MPRGGRNIPSLQQRFALKGKMLVYKRRGGLVVQAWPKPYGAPRSQAQADTQTAFARFQRAAKFFPPQLTIQAMEATANTGMYPRDLLMAAALGTNVMLGYDQLGANAMIGDGLQKFVAAGGETTFDFAQIPPGYTDLLITAYGRSLQSALNSTVSMSFNSDNNAVYDWGVWSDTGKSVAVAQTSAAGGWLTGATAAAGYAAGWMMLIPGYANTNFFKSYRTTGERFDSLTTNQFYAMQYFGWWRRTAAIQKITLSVPNGFTAGTAFTLRGLF